MDENQKITEYLDKLRGLKLSETSRERIKGELSAYAKFHGAEAETNERMPADSRFIGQVPLGTSLFRKLRLSNMTAIFLSLALILTGGTTYAAEGAIPGDLLYPMKVEFNERVKSAVALSSEAEARLQARLAEERLEEAETLAANGRLDADASAALNARLNKHYESANEHSGRAEADGDIETAAEVRASLTGSLNAFGAILNRLNRDVKGNDGVMLINNIEARAEAIADDERPGPDEHSEGAGTAAVEALIKRADIYVSHVGDKLVRAEGEISAEAYVRVRAHLAKAADAVAEAKAEFRSELYREAYDSAKTAIRIASEAETMLMSLLRLNVELDLSSDRLFDIEVDSDTEVNGRDNDSDEADESDDSDDSRDDTSVDVDVETDVEVDTDAGNTGAGVNGSVGGSVRLGN